MGLRDRQPAIRIQAKPRRTEVVSLRYTSQDLDLIEEAADKAGLIITDYIRRITVEQAGRDLADSPEGVAEG